MIGTGSTITFGTSGWSSNFISITPSGVKRDSVQTSHLGSTGWHSHSPVKLADGGEYTLECIFTPGATAAWPPIHADPETITIRYGSPTGPSASFSGFVTGYSEAVTLEEQITLSVTIKVNGAITYGAAS